MAKQFFRIPRPIPFDVPKFNQILKPKTNLSNYTPIFETNLWYLTISLQNRHPIGVLWIHQKNNRLGFWLLEEVSGIIKRWLKTVWVFSMKIDV